MSKILKVRNVNDYVRYLGAEEQHPLVCVIDYAEVSPVRHSLNDYGVYGIFFHDEAEIDLAYGCGKYDYKKGTVICVAPGQIGGKEDNGEQPHPPVRHPACQERPCGRGDRLPGIRPPRLRISPALQPDVQEAGGRHAVGVLPQGAEVC